MKTNPTQCFTKKNEFGFALFGGPGGNRTQKIFAKSGGFITLSSVRVAYRVAYRVA